MGVAAQSLAMLTVLAWLVLNRLQSESSESVDDFWRPYRSAPLAQFSVLVGILWLLLATASSGLNPLTSGVWPTWIGGYLWWVLGPFLILTILDRQSGVSSLEKTVFERRFCAALVIVLFLGVATALSQYMIGWKIHGTSIIRSEYRARILFSHPLSLAYIVLLYLAPVLGFLLSGVWTRPKARGLTLWTLASLLFLIVVTFSRTVQVVAAFVVLAYVIFGLRGRWRAAALACLILGGAVIARTDNPVSRRFIATIELKDERQQDRYVDDRVAFWAVHWEMFKEKPGFGHGLSYRQDYLDRYYEANELGGMQKRYPAHNMFLQLLVNTGIVGLLIWLLRLGIAAAACILLIRGPSSTESRGVLNQAPHAWIGWAGLVTMLAVALAGLTQNAFQDSAVRFHWTLLEGGLFWFTSRQSVPTSEAPEATLA